MTSKEPEPISRAAYDKLADSFAALAPTKPHNGPATLSMLGDVEGKRVLDAGCGPGIYAEEPVSGGAEVVGFDASERMVGSARERLRGRAELCRANLELVFSVEHPTFKFVEQVYEGGRQLFRDRAGGHGVERIR